MNYFFSEFQPNKKARCIAIYTILLLLAIWIIAPSRVIAQAGSSYPSFPAFGPVGLSGVNTPEFSGVTFSETSGTIFIVHDEAPNIYEYSYDGAYIRTISLANVVVGESDLESISWMDANRFVVGNEQDGMLYIIEIPSGGNDITLSSALYSIPTNIVEESNDFGMEGVAYVSGTDDADFFYALDQRDPNGWPRIHYFDQNGVELSTISIQGNPVENGSDLYFSPDEEALYVVASESDDDDNQVLKLDLSGTVLWSHSIPLFGKPEGIGFRADTEEMLVVGEPNQYARYLPPVPYDGEAIPTDGPLKVAFIGDQGVGSNSAAVLNLIKNEGAEITLVQGDLGYESSSPQAWEQQTNSTLGVDYPLFAVVGNHDDDPNDWPIYSQLLTSRLNRVPDATCVGTIGVQAACHYKGLFFVMVAPGLMGSGHESYLLDQLSNDNSLWSICSWHVNQQMMQVGSKNDEAGWGVYEACRQGGGIVATGHEHSYSRTHLMDNFQGLSVASTDNQVVISEGETFGFVSGLGGKSVRPQLLGGNHWASIYTSNQGASAGALFCTFYADGQANKADCYFKDIAGNVPDEFTVISNVDGNGEPGNGDLRTVVRSVMNGSDDGEEYVSNNQTNINSSDLELVEDSNNGDQTIGIRFQNINVPAGATITQAKITFTVDENNSRTTNLTIHGEASANPTSFATSIWNITNRPRTSANVAWNNLPSWSENQQHNTPDLSSIVQEIVDSNGWNSGNAMAFLISGSGRRTAESYNGTPTEAPLLTITYTIEPPVMLGDVNCDESVNIIDALFIAQYEVEMRTEHSSCPLDDPATTLYVQVGDVNSDGTVNIIDALFVAQCEVSIANVLCPEE